MSDHKLVDKCCEKKTYIPGLYKPGYLTEYTDNYVWSSYLKYRDIENNLKDCEEWAQNLNEEKFPTAIYDGKTSLLNRQKVEHIPKAEISPSVKVEAISNNLEYQSANYDSIYRSKQLKRLPDGGYEDPFKNLVTNNYGRRLIYDITHPDIVHPSLPSSELADVANIYSFKSPIRARPDIPWTKDLTWKAESQEGNWPTKLWKLWTNTASAPSYDGHDDQCQYSKYKVPLSNNIAMIDANRGIEIFSYNCKY